MDSNFFKVIFENEVCSLRKYFVGAFLKMYTIISEDACMRRTIKVSKDGINA